MPAIGKVKNVKGFIKSDELYLKTFGDDFYLSRRYLMGVKTRTVKLSNELASVKYDNMMETSASGTVARTVLGGLAGSTWNKNRMVSGALMGLASSTNTRKMVYTVELTFNDGRKLTGKTNQNVIQALVSISPQMSDSDRENKIKNDQKFQRYLDDAPKTYFENKKELDKLKSELVKYQSQIENGKSFDSRDRAIEMSAELERQIKSKETLNDELLIRAKAIKKLGFYDDYQKKWPVIIDTMPKIEKGLIMNKFMLYSSLVCFYAGDIN